MRSSEYPTPYEVRQTAQAEKPAQEEKEPFKDYFKDAIDEVANVASAEQPQDESEEQTEEQPQEEIFSSAEPKHESRQLRRLKAQYEAQSVQQPEIPRPIEMGQVVIHATQTEDALSEKAFNNTAPDKREHRRVSTPTTLSPVETSTKTAPIDENEKPEDIPADVVAEVATHMKRADFVKQQEDLFGKNDKIKPEDVPEGELTYEQWLAQRPVAEEGDTYRITDAKGNVSVHDAVTGSFASKADHEAKLENSDPTEHYNAVQVEGDRAAVIDEALAENETKNKSYDGIIRSNIEGEFLVEKDARLKGLLSLGEELLELYNSDEQGEDFEKNIRPKLEAKKAIYDDLYELYLGKDDVDSRALGYIGDKTGVVDDPDFIPVEGAPYLNNERVDILDFTETPDGKKAYTIEKEDGSIEAVYTEEVAFKREFEDYVAPEEEKLSRLDRIKDWFGKGREKFRESAGIKFFETKWHDANNWLTTHRLDPNETPEGAEARKYINRRNRLLGGAVVVAVALAAKYAGMDHGGTGQFVASIFDQAPGSTPDVNPISNAGGDHYASINAIERAAGQGGEPQFDLAIPGYDASLEPGAINIDNETYNIKSGGSLTDVFNGAFGDSGVASDKLKQHALELANQYPGTFYVEDGDIRIANTGWLPADVRQTIEAYKNS